MKTNIFTISCFLVATASFAFADEPLKESTELQAQEQSREAYQTQVDRDEMTTLIQAMNREQFRNTNMVRVQRIIEEAQQEGLPTKPLTDKVYEGIAKNVEEENIVRALATVRNRYSHGYRQAREMAIDPQQERQLGDLIARSYSAGLAEKDCDTIMAALKTRIRTMNQSQAQKLTIQTMTTARAMAHRGVHSATVSDVLTDALDQSYQASDMEEMRRSFLNRARHGSAEIVAQHFAAGINQGLDAKALSSSSGGNPENDDSKSSRADSGASGSGGSNSSDGSGDSGNTNGSSSESGSSGGSGNSGGSSAGSGGGAGGGRGK